MQYYDLYLINLCSYKKTVWKGKNKSHILNSRLSKSGHSAWVKPGLLSYLPEVNEISCEWKPSVVNNSPVFHFSLSLNACSLWTVECSTFRSWLGLKKHVSPRKEKWWRNTLLTFSKCCPELLRAWLLPAAALLGLSRHHMRRFIWNGERDPW